MIYLWFQVDKMLKDKDDQIERLRNIADHERSRAEKAIDELLRKSNCMPVSQESRKRIVDDESLKRNLSRVSMICKDIDGGNDAS